MTAGAKATAEREAVHKEDSAEETEAQMVGLVKQRNLISKKILQIKNRHRW